MSHKEYHSDHISKSKDRHKLLSYIASSHQDCYQSL